MSLRRFAAIVGAAAFALSLAGSANALTITFDENGNGVLDGVPITGVLAPDPSQPGHPLALIYDLGANIVGVGDVGVLEFGNPGEFSDWIRFTNADGSISGTSGNLLIFYSACAEVCDALADTGFPTNIGSGATADSVTEAQDGTFLFVAGFNKYNGISDETVSVPSVPEPLTLSIYGIGLVVAAGLRRQRAKAA